MATYFERRVPRDRADQMSNAAARAGEDGTFRLELMQIFLRQAQAVMVVNVAIAILVVAVVWPRVEGSALIAWGAALVAFALARGAMWIFVRQRVPMVPETAAYWTRAAVVSSALGGVGWGVGGILVFLCSDSPIDHVFFAFVLGGMGAGAMAGLTAILPVFFATIWPMLLPYGVILFFGDNFMHIAMGAMILLFLADLSVFGRNVSRWVQSSVLLRHENEGLVNRLIQAREVSDNEVVERTRELSRANQELEDRLRDLAAAQRALTENEREMRLVMDSVPAAIAFIDGNLRLKYVNRQYETWYGVSRDHVQGMPVPKVIGEAAFAEIEDCFTRVLRGELVTYEVERETAAGMRRLEVNLVPNRLAGGRIDGVIALGVDRTEAYEAHEAVINSEDRLRRVIQNMPVMMFALDDEGEVIVWNRECERVTGYQANEIVGNPRGLELLWPDLTQREQVRRSLLEHSDYRDWEWDILCKGGGSRTISWFNISAAYPVPGWSSWQMGFDVSVRRRARVELEQALERERELGELKSRFVAMASHEFRTPLTTIQAAVEIIQRYGERMKPDERDENFGEIKREVGNITKLLDDILSFGRAEAGQMEVSPAPLDLPAMFEELADTARRVASDAHVIEVVTSEECGEVLLDEQIVRQVVNNLLSNAVKYSPDGGRISLEARCDGLRVKITCSDEGMGIPETGRERLFEPFHRFGNVGAISGTGLGLAIVRRAVASHGGTIICESNEGQGTTFHVTMLQSVERADLGQAATVH